MCAELIPELVNHREFAASRERVFAACSDPAQLAQWWGPHGFTNTFHRFEFQPDGAWRFTLRGPDGAAYEMDHRFMEIVAPERVVVRHIQAGHDFTLEMHFEARGDRTALTWRMRFDDPAETERLRAFILPANEQNFDRLEALLSAPLSETGQPVR